MLSQAVEISANVVVMGVGIGRIHFLLLLARVVTLSQVLRSRFEHKWETNLASVVGHRGGQQNLFVGRIHQKLAKRVDIENS